MGTSTDAYLIVGGSVEGLKHWEPLRDLDTSCHNEVFDWAEDNGLRVCDPEVEDDVDYSFIGFTIKAPPIQDMSTDWLILIKDKAIKFQELTGIKAKLLAVPHRG